MAEKQSRTHTIGYRLLWIATIFSCALLVSGPAVGQDDQWLSLIREATSLSQRAEYDRALLVGKQALEIAERRWGPDDLRVATSLGNLGNVYLTQGKFAEAEPLFERALRIWERGAPGHAGIATPIGNLASLYVAQGRYAAAEPLFNRSLTITEKAVGTEHPEIAMRLNALAELYRRQSKYAQAEPLYERALSIWEKSRGPTHIDVARALNNLATLYMAQLKYAEAEPLYVRSLAIREKAHGPKHPDVANSLNNLATLYIAQGQHVPAEALLKRSISIWDDALDRDHPLMALSLYNLAFMYSSRGQYAAAEPLYMRSLAIREKALGPEHPDVAASLEKISDLYAKMGKTEDAKLFADRAAKVRELTRNVGAGRSSAPLSTTPLSAASPLEPGKAVESDGIATKPGIGISKFPVSVHVILQIHEHPVAERRASQDLGRVTACQESIVSTVLSLARKGVPTVVVEGLYSSGTLEMPSSPVVAESPQSNRTNAKWVLANRKELSVYGFEIKPLNDFAVGIANELGKSSGKAVNLEKETEGSNSNHSEEIKRLVQEEVTRINLWWAGIVPARSFMALQSALSIALARGVNQIQLVIGKEHWKDLVYAANRNSSVRLRLVPYECP